MELDRPGKDSFRHREAGAEEVLLVGGARWALLHETPENAGIVAVATDAPVLDGYKGVLLDLNDAAGIARWIVAFRSSRIAGA
jgi:molybdopterin-guanine dinucleotide biosynthesis protein MobB